MRVLAILLLLPGLAPASALTPCTFVVGHGTQLADSAAGPGEVKPEWFVVSGRAEVEMKGTKLNARLFDSRLAGDLSHTFAAQLSRPVHPGRSNRATVRATLKTMNTDSGDDALSGSIVIAQDPAGRGLWQSLVVQNANSFVGFQRLPPRAA
jgi:hypothetical protein